MAARASFTAEEARRIGEQIGIDWPSAPFDLEQFRAGLDVDVVCGGGLFHRDAPAFLQRIRSELVRLAPAARLTQLTAPPVVGAALLGLDRLGAPPGAAEGLRATLTHERLGALQPVAASNR